MCGPNLASVRLGLPSGVGLGKKLVHYYDVYIKREVKGRTEAETPTICPTPVLLLDGIHLV